RDGRKFLAERARAVLDRRVDARPSRDPRGAARRCRHRQLLRCDARRRSRLPRDVLRARRRRSARRRQRPDRGEGRAQVRRLATTALLAAACLVHGASARAQSSGALPVRVELAAGASWIGPMSLGSLDASETTSTGGAMRLFSTSTTLGGAPAVDGRVAVRLAQSLWVEGEASLARQDLRVEITNDQELPNT